MAVVDYKCLNCNAKLEFKADKQLWHCDYCQSEYTLQELEAAYADRDNQSDAVDDSTHSHDWAPHRHTHEEFQPQGEAVEESLIREWHCDNCGAEIIGDQSTVATHCAYCGNTAIMPRQLEGSYRPEMLIPFSITREQAEQALVDRVKKLKFVSNYFIEQKQLEKLTGIYVATWLYDTEAHVKATLSGERVSTRRVGDIEETKHQIYQIERDVNFDFKGVPVDASKKMDDTLMEAIEPFDYKKMQPFAMPYLSGYFADRYDEKAEDRRQRADERIEKTAQNLLMESVTGFSNVKVIDSDLDIVPKNIVYALLPVWLMSVKWEGKDYLFAINGQTGKFVGDLPIDTTLQRKSVGTFALIGTIVFIIGAFLFKMFM